jgi:hypothetical protein
MIAHATRPRLAQCKFCRSVLPPDRPAEPPPDEPSELEPEPDGPADPSDLDFEELPCTDDDSRWDAFIPDDDERDPQPAPGDFWIE